MSVACIGSQVVVKMPTRIGLLADIARAVREAGVNINALCAYEEDHVGHIMFASDDNHKAVEAVEALGAEVKLDAVVVVEIADEPGALEIEARKIANAGLNIDYVYGGAGGGKATIVFSMVEADAAASALG